MGPVSGLLWLAGAGGGRRRPASCPGAPQRASPCCSGASSPLTVVYSVACVTRRDPVGSRVARRARARRRRAAAARRRRALADRRRGRVHGRRCSCCRCSTWPTSSRPRYAWPLAALEVAHLRVAARHRDGRRQHLLVRRARSPTRSPTRAWWRTIQFLKRRLVAAERHQHRMARVDPLTGLAEPARLRRGAQRRARRRQARSRCCWPTSTPSSRSTTASATRPATACCASSPRTPPPRSAAATAWRASAATSSRSSPRAPAPRPRAASPTRCARPAPRVDAGDGPVSLTVSSAVYPEDGTDRFTLMRTARPRAARDQGRRRKRT